MNNFPIIGIGVASLDQSGKTLSVFYPVISCEGGSLNYDKSFVQLDALTTDRVTAIHDLEAMSGIDPILDALLKNMDERCKLVLCKLSEDKPIELVEEAYLKLHLLSYKIYQPNTLNLDNLFNILPNVAWTNHGPQELEEAKMNLAISHANHGSFEIKSMDKFPQLTDFVIPPQVRIADTSRVRLGAYLSEGTTIMHEGFVNFNAGTLGPAMIEGRISAGVVVGKNSDLGGGCSTMGTLSGGNNVRISIGENCLLGANSGLGIQLGNNCIVEAGLYLTAGATINVLDKNLKILRSVKAAELSGEDNLLFIRNSLSGALEARVNTKSVALNSSLHDNS